MAILATRRRWLVTSRCAASRSPCSRQRLASIYSSCGSSIGNRRISSRYRPRPDSAVMIGKIADWAMTAPSSCSAPEIGRQRPQTASSSRSEPEIYVGPHPSLPARGGGKGGGFAATANDYNVHHTQITRRKQRGGVTSL